MPRIRKKTSNRQNTRDRAKITKKVAEHKKKTKRDSKRDVTWKSNKKKDLGVPNNFPYKDRVLAELAEEKRKTDEAKQAQRDANKRKQQGEDEEDTPGIMSLVSGVLSASAPVPVLEVDAEAESPEVPELVDTGLATLQDALDKADVIVQVVDARDIQGGRSAWVQNLVEESGGKYALLVNKIDLVPRENLNSWVQHLPAQTYLFSTNPPVSDPSSSTRPGKTEFLAALARWASERKDGDLTISLMGLPNVGKTSVLNTLLGSTKYTVAPSVTTAAAAKNPRPTTLKPVEVSLSVEGKNVAVIDTPGWEFIEDDDDEEMDEDNIDEAKWDEMEQRVVGDLLRRNVGRIDRIKDVFPLVNFIVKRSNAQDLMLAYNIPYFQDGDVDTFLLSLARANGRIRKHGNADLESTARIVLRDWAQNTFPYYSTPPTTEKITAERPDVQGVLALCRTRKEMRATGKGVIRFTGGAIDTRDVIVDDNYLEMAGSSDDEDDDEDDEEVEGRDEVEEDDEDEEEELDEEDEAVLIGAQEGEELDLEDGSEPSSGSDVEDDDEEEEEEEEEVEERSPSPAPAVTQKRKRKSDVSVAAPKKAKTVTFGKNDVRVMEDVRPVKGGKRKRR